MSDILELNGLSEALLHELSYESKLEKSLKKNLHYFNKESLIDELINMTEWLDEQIVLSMIPMDYRIKSIDSIILKYDRYYPDHQVRKVFNDILGFRGFCDNYNDVLTLKSDFFRIADMSNGKSNDDGYRGVHVYYQKNNLCYPIEIQFNTLYDRCFNNWLHNYVYKKQFSLEIGRQLRAKYETGHIKTEDNFKEALCNVLRNS